ncbi:MAG: vWA domain-containing protein [Gaiellales bacterium]
MTASPAPGDAVVARLVGFGRVLRAEGLEVGPGRLQDALRGLDAIDLADRTEVYHALRCTLVSRHDDIPAFDAAFADYWEHVRREGRPRMVVEGPQQSQIVPAHDAGAPTGEDSEADDEPPLAAVYSASELLRQRDFAEMTTDELLSVYQLLVPLARAQPRRRSRRLAPAHAAGVLDQRRTLRGSMRTQGVPLERAWRRPKLVPRKLVFLCDVSGSMEPYARAMVLFLTAMTAAGRRVEAFAFGTRLTRLTTELAGRHPQAALARSALAMPDWGGGTRIGEALHAYNRDYGRRAYTRGAVVVVVSDGWERGDLALLDRELARLHRAAHLLVWVNPLKGHEGFEPLAGGMRTALDHADVFLEGHNVAALEGLAGVLQAVSGRGAAAPAGARPTTTRVPSALHPRIAPAGRGAVS